MSGLWSMFIAAPHAPEMGAYKKTMFLSVLQHIVV